jgi:hypothetical protein
MGDPEPLEKYPDEAQRYAVCKSIYDGPIGAYRKAFAPEKISFDYDETLTTEKGMELAKQWISKGADVYIISARGSIEPMLTRAQELGIPKSRIYATGSNKAKVEKILQLGISKHYDNNADVIKQLGNIGQLI